jgi:hypothetical protein
MKNIFIILLFLLQSICAIRYEFSFTLDSQNNISLQDSSICYEEIYYKESSKHDSQEVIIEKIRNNILFYSAAIKHLQNISILKLMRHINGEVPEIERLLEKLYQINMDGFVCQKLSFAEISTVFNSIEDDLKAILDAIKSLTTSIT